MNNSNTLSVGAKPRASTAIASRPKLMKTINLIRFVAAILLRGSVLLASDPAAVVNIPDPSLQAAIRATLNKRTGDITVGDMESLTALDASRSTRGCVPPIQTLEGLQA